MKLDISNWVKLEESNAWHTAPQGRLRLRFAKPVAVICETACPHTGEVSEAIIGYGAETDATYSPDLIVRFKAAEKVLGYVHDPAKEVIDLLDVERVFTNVDKMPLESEHVLEVKKALRLMKYQIAHETAARVAEIRRMNPDDLAQPEPEPEPDPDSQPEQMA